MNKKVLCSFLLLLFAGIIYGCGKENAVIEQTEPDNNTLSVSETTISQTNSNTTTNSTTTEIITTTVVQTTRAKTEKEKMYDEYYNYLVQLGEGTCALYDIDGDNMEDMLISDTFGLSYVTYKNGAIQSEAFGIFVTLNNARYSLINSNSNKKYIVCRTDQDNESKLLYYNIDNDEGLEVTIKYTSDVSGGYSAKWDVSDPTMKGGLFGLYDMGTSSVLNIYELPSEMNPVLYTAAADKGITINDNSTYIEIPNMTFNELRQKLLDLSGRDSSLVGNNNSDEAIYGSGYIKTDVDVLNVRKEPNINSDVLNQIPNGTQVNIIDDSYSGWLLISGIDVNHIYYGYVSADYVVWNIN